MREWQPLTNISLYQISIHMMKSTKCNFEIEMRQMKIANFLHRTVRGGWFPSYPKWNDTTVSNLMWVWCTCSSIEWRMKVTKAQVTFSAAVFKLHRFPRLQGIFATTKQHFRSSVLDAIAELWLWLPMLCMEPYAYISALLHRLYIIPVMYLCPNRHSLNPLPLSWGLKHGM